MVYYRFIVVTLTVLHLVVWWDPVLPASLLRLQEGGQGNIVLGHHPVQHILVPVGVLDCQLVELNQLFLHQGELACPIEDRAPVHVLPVALRHRLPCSIELSMERTEASISGSAREINMALSIDNELNCF